MPWRGVQEKLKESLSSDIKNKDDVAFKLVPEALNAVIGKQNKAWATEKRPSKSGKGSTTWIVLIN